MRTLLRGLCCLCLLFLLASCAPWTPFSTGLAGDRYRAQQEAISIFPCEHGR